MTETTRPSTGKSSGISADAVLDVVLDKLNSPPEPSDLSGPAMENSAVARCCQAYMQTIQTARKAHKDRFSARTCANEAYRNAMPPLSGSENIRDFIACVAHGILINAINSSDGARLLYASQVAQGALEKPVPRSVGRPKFES